MMFRNGNSATRYLLFTALLLISLHETHALYKQNLSGVWVLSSDIPVRIEMTVPGDIYSALHKAGKIEDPLYRDNDIRTRWVAWQNFTLERSVKADDDLLKEDAIDLVLDGLDTIADVYLDSHLLGTSRSMFIRSSFDVASILKAQTGALNLAVKITSPPLSAKFLVGNDKPIASPPFCPPASFHGECYVNQIRKQQSSFGWDWGLAIPTSGIYWGVYLLGYSVHIRYINVDTTQSSSESSLWTFKLTAWLESSANVQVFATFRAAEFATANQTLQLNAGLQPVSVTFSANVDDSQLWWPHTHGAQPLFPLNVTIRTVGGKVLDSDEVQFGVRQISLVQNALSNGLTFYFSVNGRPIYAKGSNWVPLDAVVGSDQGVRNARIDALLNAVVQGKQNMIRVWGGGLYESDYFYEQCDRLGILLWQDFMFACALYPHPQSPVAKDFYEAVRSEAQHQLLRLQRHPSVAIWAGNNENEAAMAGNWYDSSSNYSYFYDAYVYLYVDTLRNFSLRLDPGRAFVTSSPSNGKESEQEGWIARNPYDIRFGDLHFYQYSGELWRFAYSKSRFVSEYGFQSLASLESWLVSTNPDLDWDWDPVSGSTSVIVNWREHLVNGITYLVNSIDQHFSWRSAKLPQHTLAIVLRRDPSLVTVAQQRFGAFVYLSQVEQSEIIAAQTRTYRAASRCDLDAQGGGFNMGSMYWQLNDVWHTISWSSVDYTLRRKSLHFAMGRLFQNELIFFKDQLIDDTDKLLVYYVNEQLISSQKQLCSAESLTAPPRRVSIRCHQLNNVKASTEVHYELANVTLAQQFSNAVVQANASEYLSNCKCAELTACALHALLLDNNNQVISEDFYLFDFPKSLQLSKANVTVDSIAYVARNAAYFDFEVTVRTDVPALYVCLDAHHIDGHFSDNNCLHLFDDSRQLVFHSYANVTISALRSQLTVTTLTDLQSDGSFDQAKKPAELPQFRVAEAHDPSAELL